jgi:hypothetical protein
MATSHYKYSKDGMGQFSTVFIIIGVRSAHCIDKSDENAFQEEF